MITNLFTGHTIRLESLLWIGEVVIDEVDDLLGMRVARVARIELLLMGMHRPLVKTLIEQYAPVSSELILTEYGRAELDQDGNERHSHSVMPFTDQQNADWQLTLDRTSHERGELVGLWQAWSRLRESVWHTGYHGRPTVQSALEDELADRIMGSGIPPNDF